MSLPEISRRCLSCGASARAGGRFCPQCGAKLDAAPPGGEGAAGADASAKPNINAGASEPPKPQAPGEFAGAFARPNAPAQTRAAAEEVKEKVKESKPASEEVREAKPVQVTEAAAAVEQPAVEGRSAGAAATEAARGRRAAAVRESLRPRVERVRDASMGVIEEASEDTGLRFVLISLAFFLLFLLLLLLNSLLK